MASKPRPFPAAEVSRENLYTRATQLVIAPLTFLSFLLSLALISERNERLRRRYHLSASATASSNTISGRIQETLHDWIWKETEGPYAYVRSPDAVPMKRENSGSSGKAQEDENWHLSTRQREMMRMEVFDAFELRQRVVVLMVVGLGTFVGTLGYWAWTLGRYL